MDVDLLDEALIRLRRLWHMPPEAVVAAGGPGPPIELSTVLVADAIARADRVRPAAPVRIGQIAHRLDVAPSTASRLVDRAVRVGMVDRERHPDDPRATALTLTAAGVALLHDARRFRIGYLRRVLRDWPPDDVAALARLLHRFAAAVHDAGGPLDSPKEQ